MYQVGVPPKPGHPPVLRWIAESALAHSAEADAWKYAWWNRETQVYENPPDDDDDEDL